MLAGDAAAGLDAGGHDLPAGHVHARREVRIAAVEGDVGVQVAVARVEDVADASRWRSRISAIRSRMSGRRVRGTTASCTARSGAIRPMAPNAFFRPCQSRARSARVEATAHRAGAALAEERLTRRGLRLDRVRLAVELDQQHRRGVGRIARGVDRGLDRGDAGLVHHLDRRRHDAWRRSWRRPPRWRRGRWGSRPAWCARSRGTGVEPHRDLGGDAEHPLAAHEQPRPGRGPRARRGASPARPVEPSGSTTSSRTMWLVVTPYLRQCGPPAFSATLPPTVQAAWLEGSGT